MNGCWRQEKGCRPCWEPSWTQVCARLSLLWLPGWQTLQHLPGFMWDTDFLTMLMQSYPSLLALNEIRHLRFSGQGGRHPRGVWSGRVSLTWGVCLQGDAGFLTVVIALVKVEVTLLLRDALEPEAHVPSSWQATASKPTAEQSQGPENEVSICYRLPSPAAPWQSWMLISWAWWLGQQEKHPTKLEYQASYEYTFSESTDSPSMLALQIQRSVCTDSN